MLPLPETAAFEKIYLILETNGWSDWMPGAIPGQGGRQVGQTGDDILSSPSSSARSGGVISGTGCMVPQPFAAGGNRSYPEFWAVTGAPQYLGY
jgi:hypothetical protein